LEGYKLLKARIAEKRREVDQAGYFVEISLSFHVVKIVSHSIDFNI